MEEKIGQLEKIINYSFINKKLLIEALTHKSFKQEYNNERLEFLGDAILDLVIAEYLFKKFPKENEGILSKTRASLVNAKSFSKMAKFISLGDFILISTSEENNYGRLKSSLLSNAFEAIIGAVYLDSGLQRTNDLIIDLLNKNYNDLSLEVISRDFKSSLQEFTQAEFGTTPDYKIISTNGPDHNKTFEIAIILNGDILAKAIGKNKKDAQQKAAEIVLQKFNRTI